MKSGSASSNTGEMWANKTLMKESKISAMEKSVKLLRTLGELPTACSPCFSPDGSFLAYISDVSGSLQAWVVDVKTGEKRQVTRSDDPVGIVSWSPDGNSLLLSIAPGGNGGNVQLYLTSPEGTELFRLSEGGSEANWSGPWIPHSPFIAVTSNRSDPSSFDSYLLNTDTRTFTLVAKNTGLAMFSDVSPDGKKALLYQMANRGSSKIFLVHLGSSEKEDISPLGDEFSHSEARFTKDGKSVLFASDFNREFPVLCQIRIDASKQGLEPKVLAENPEGGLEEFALSPDGKTAVLFWNVSGATQITILHLDCLSQAKGPTLPAEIASSPVFSPDGRSLAFNLMGPAVPQGIFLLNLETQEVSQLSHPIAPDLELPPLIRPTKVSFPSHDGLPLSGWLYAPMNHTQPGPVIVSFHGGPESQERPTFRSDYHVLLNHGFLIFAPNVRGSTGFGRSFGMLDNGPLRFDAIKDIKACADFLVTAGIADKNRLGVYGASYGGYMVLAGITTYPGLFSAAASLYGIASFETFFRNTHPSMAEISKTKFGDPETQAELLAALSPINKIQRITTPTLLLHGKNDSNVPLGESEQVYEKLQEMGVDTKLVVFPDEGHGFLKKDNKNRSALETLDWFRTFL
jgi:dipeptidyl aminopeptidase/acylaminoacyl peptidase